MFREIINKVKRKPEISRRFFFQIGFWGSIAIIISWIWASIRFFFPKVLFEPPMSFVAGLPLDFPRDSVSTKFKDEHRLWIIHNEEGIYALMAICTHLGCTPNFFEDEKIFKCPCHGSNFNLHGDVVAGPAPEPLFRPAIKLNSKGQITINKAVQENKIGEREKQSFLLKV